eukprot:4533082-Alexandrium_andersonii.AAC.1
MPFKYICCEFNICCIPFKYICCEFNICCKSTTCVLQLFRSHPRAPAQRPRERQSRLLAPRARATSGPQ